MPSFRGTQLTAQLPDLRRVAMPRTIATESLLGPVTLGLWTLHLPDREL